MPKRKIPLFVTGCQRSGTTMFMDVLKNSPQVNTYGEENKEGFQGTILRSDSDIRRLIRKSDKTVVAFKPLNNSQELDRILAIYPNSKAIWIYRHYNDVINSVLKKWNHIPEMMREVAENHYTKEVRKVIGVRISRDARSFVKKMCDADPSPNDFAAMLWFVRNILFFELNLASFNQVLLCKYEDLVLIPEKGFNEAFNFIGIDCNKKYTRGVHSASIKKNTAPVLMPEVESQCQKLWERLNSQYTQKKCKNPHNTKTKN